MEQLGVGKFGVVYKAMEKLSTKIVAIKIVPKKRINTLELKKQMQR
jgi:serine/threonine protein kinase